MLTPFTLAEDFLRRGQRRIDREPARHVPQEEIELHSHGSLT